MPTPAIPATCESCHHTPPTTLLAFPRTKADTPPSASALCHQCYEEAVAQIRRHGLSDTVQPVITPLPCETANRIHAAFNGT